METMDIPDTPVNRAAIAVLAEWAKQTEERRFSTRELTPLMYGLAEALRAEDRNLKIVKEPTLSDSLRVNASRSKDT